MKSKDEPESLLDELLEGGTPGQESVKPQVSEED